MANKVRYGLKNVHVCSVTVGTQSTTFGTPTAMAGAVKMSIEAQGDTSTFYADDVPYFVDTVNNGYTGELEIAELSDDFIKAYLGAHEDDAHNIVEKSSDKGAPFALLFEFDGDDKSTRHIFYYCKASRPKIESNTVSETKEPSTTTLEFTAIPVPNTEIIKAKTTPTSTNYTTWFTSAPVLPTFTL